MADIQMVLATDYSRNLSIEVKKGQSQRLKQGYWPFRAPLGYRDMGEAKLKEPCPKKAPLVRELFRLYLTGEYSITSLTDAMRVRGLTGYYDRPLARRNVDAILRNPYYCGQLVSRQGVFKGIHTPLISVRDYKRVQAIKAARHIKKRTKLGHRFRNTFTCDRCEKFLTGERQKSHIYYRCHTPGCPEKSYREDRLEAEILTALKKHEWTDEQVAAFRCELEKRGGLREQDELRASLNLRAADVQTRQARLMDLYIDGKITEGDYRLRDERLKLDLAQIDEERAGLATLRANRSSAEELLNFVTSVSTVYEVSSDPERRILLRDFFAVLRVRDGRLRLMPQTFDVLETKMSV